MNANRHSLIAATPAGCTGAVTSPIGSTMSKAIQLEGYRFDGAHDAIRFTFNDGARQVHGLVSRACLEDDFLVQSDELQDWLSACVRYTIEIEFTALTLWHEGAPEPVVVKPGSIRLWSPTMNSGALSSDEAAEAAFEC